MTYLIFGGAGFIGLNLIEQLLSSSEQVIAFDRACIPTPATVAFSRLSGDLKVIQGDVTDLDEVSRAISDNSIRKIFYGAAVTAGSNREKMHPETIFSTNTIGLINVLKVAAETPSVERLINISSGSAYGDGGFGDTGWNEPLDEYNTHEAPKSLYAISKYAGERIAFRMGQLLGLQVQNVRLSSIFGPWEYDTGLRDTLSAPMQASLLALKGSIALIDRRENRDWTYSRYVASALCALMDHQEPKSSLYNITSEKTWSVIDWCALLATTFPDFRYRLIEPGETPNVDFFGHRDRLAMSSDRFIKDIGYVLPFNIKEIYKDFEHWLKDTDDFWE
ncbi:MAG: hypothetical protein CMM58_01950 [Rhodospirillaceae bacterium]|nr:hypothetical protein [Rhodospirillaceae bacterium]|tara:strand:- start:3267 stop:4268 length:1002 start_codon:yes stop_codon:yes gene_type:complete